MISKLQYISEGATPQEHLDNIQKACASGIEWVQLNLKDVKEATVLKTAKRAREITGHFQTRLIITDYPKIAKEVKADGVHLELKGICPTIARKELASWQTIGAAAHTLEDCKELIGKKVNYIVLGPFRTEEEKGDLGEKGYLSILEKLNAEIPIIATGGITQNDVLDIMITGVYGIAVSRSITSNFNSIAKFKEVVTGEALQEQRWKPGMTQNNDKE